MAPIAAISDSRELGSDTPAPARGAPPCYMYHAEIETGRPAIGANPVEPGRNARSSPFREVTGHRTPDSGLWTQVPGLQRESTESEDHPQQRLHRLQTGHFIEPVEQVVAEDEQ